MSINDYQIEIAPYLIKLEDFRNYDIATLPDSPSAAGISAEELKNRFDAISKKIIRPKYNAFVEEMARQYNAMLVFVGENSEVGIFNADYVAELKNEFWRAEKSRAVLQEQIYKNQRSLRQIEWESNTITLNNSKKYPFNNSLQTISLAEEREKLDYQVHVEVLAASGGFVKEIEVKDKQTNGFKLGYTGSATSVQVRYIIEGGYY